jgi:DnaJ family protein C protein 9
MYKKVTKESIKEFMDTYKGSDKQVQDVKDAYVKYKGNKSHILETVIGFSPENEDKLDEIIWYLIEKKEVEAYPKFVNEPASAREKRLKNSQKEAKVAKKYAQKLKREGKFAFT